MSGNKVLDGLIKSLGKAGMAKAGDALGALAREADTPWKRAVLRLVEDAVSEFGPMGIEKARKALARIAGGKVPDLEFASLRVRSDVLARLQNEEAARRKEALVFMEMVAKTLGEILASVIKGIIAA